MNCYYDDMSCECLSKESLSLKVVLGKVMMFMGEYSLGSQEYWNLLCSLPEYNFMTRGHLLPLLDSSLFIYMFNLCDFYV